MVDEGVIEKVLNSLGKKLAMDYYGLDLHFTVLGVEVEHEDFYTIRVTTDKPIPTIFGVSMEPNMKYGRFASIQDLMFNLEYLLRYIGINHANIKLIQESWPPTWVSGTSDDAPLKHPTNYIELPSVGAMLEVDTGYTYPKYQSGKIDSREGYHLAHIDNDEWWESLSPEDIQVLDNIYS